MRRIAALQARLMSALAQASATTNWTAESAPVCPECGAPTQSGGQHPRHLQGPGGADIPLQRSDVVCWPDKVSLSELEQDEYLRKGCKFAGRCPAVMEQCKGNMPADIRLEDVQVKCQLYAEPELIKTI